MAALELASLLLCLCNYTKLVEKVILHLRETLEVLRTAEHAWKNYTELSVCDLEGVV